MENAETGEMEWHSAEGGEAALAGQWEAGVGSEGEGEAGAEPTRAEASPVDVGTEAAAAEDAEAVALVEETAPETPAD